VIEKWTCAAREGRGDVEVVAAASDWCGSAGEEERGDLKVVAASAKVG
jgi:hypothetical protein